MESTTQATASLNEDQTYWLKHISGSTQSKLSCVAYCRQHEVNYHRFKYWQKKLSKSPAKKLIPVTIKIASKTAAMAESYCELELPNGARIHIKTQSAFEQLLKQVLS